MAVSWTGSEPQATLATPAISDNGKSLVASYRSLDLMLDMHIILVGEKRCFMQTIHS